MKLLPSGILVKIIVARDEKAKNSIIKATNSQTSVSPVSLLATEPVQFDIEDRLLRMGLFYDRRKGKYRLQKKQIKNIVSIKAMGQAIIAAYLQKPSDSRGRPENPLSDEKILPQIFGPTHSLDFYAACIQIDRRCASFVSGRTDLTDDEKVDLRYYVTMLAACKLCGKAHPTSDDIATALPRIDASLDDNLLEASLGTAKAVYKELGGTDKVAKGRELETRLVALMEGEFPAI